jgi:N-acetylglucosamine kinase-like BadF-type ATPase
MTQYVLGTDIGGTKTHALIADENGHVVGFGETGPGNHETVGYDGLVHALSSVFVQAISQASISPDQIRGAGFGVAGYDWQSEREATLKALSTLGLKAPLAAYNDTIIGLLAGSSEGWGVAVVSGTGCNCWGWDRTRQHIGHVTGGGINMGEGAGGSELVHRAIWAVAHQWTQRGPATSITPAFIHYVGADDLEDLLDGLTNGRYEIEAPAAPLVFQCAANGDPIANDLIRWAGSELGELANAVIHQLQFETLAFEVVLVGRMYDGGPLLIDAMRHTIQAIAPGAQMVRTTTPPVVGAVLLGMEQAGIQPTHAVRQELARSIEVFRNSYQRVIIR